MTTRQQRGGHLDLDCGLVSVVCSDSYIVRVKAVVMTRDESSGGWLAQDGCLSRVGVARLLPSELLGRNSFLIHGERLKDKQVGPSSSLVLSTC